MIKYSIEEEVMFYDTDCGGVVHNIAYLRMVEKCRTKLAQQMGMSLREMGTGGVFPVVVRTEIDYLRPAKLGDFIKIDGFLESVQRARFACAFVLSVGVGGQVVAKCEQILALVKMPEGRPVRLPAEWRNWRRSED